MLKISIKNHTRVLACLLLTSGLSIPAFAQEQVLDIPPAPHVDASTSMPAGDETHSALKLTPDKSEIINLDQDAKSVVVGNPAHINVIADSARRLVIVPRAPGASYFAVLNKSGDIIMKRHVLVASPQADYVRIKRTCQGEECEKTSVFYCPDTCHEVILNTQDSTASQAEATSDAANTTSGATNASSADNSTEE